MPSRLRSCLVHSHLWCTAICHIVALITIVHEHRLDAQVPASDFGRLRDTSINLRLEVSKGARPIPTCQLPSLTRNDVGPSKTIHGPPSPRHVLEPCPAQRLLSAQPRVITCIHTELPDKALRRIKLSNLRLFRDPPPQHPTHSPYRRRYPSNRAP